MAGIIEVEVDARGLGQLIANLQSISDKIDPSVIATEVGAIMLDRIRKRFLAGQDTQGKLWPVSGAALARRATGKGGKTLFDTGTLFNSIQLARQGKNAARIGTNVPYARQHQDGLEGNIKREFIGVSDADRRDMEKFIRNRIARLVN